MAEPPQRIPAEPPAPPGDQVEAPELDVEPPDERETPDGEAVSGDGVVMEPPD